jgi:hypothetical protein
MNLFHTFAAHYTECPKIRGTTQGAMSNYVRELWEKQ